MKFIWLIWAGLWRKKLRTILTFVSIAVAFLLFGFLQSVHGAFSNIAESANLNRLHVYSKHSGRLPFFQGRQIASIDGIATVSWSNWMGGYFQDPKETIQTQAVTPDAFFTAENDFLVAAEDLAAFQKNRIGAIAGVDLLKKYHWKIGDHVPINQPIYGRKDGSQTWEFEIVGSFDWRRPEWRGHVPSDFLFVQWDYFNELRDFETKSLVDGFSVIVEDSAQSTTIERKIDALFANSADETTTRTEKELRQSGLKRFADVNWIVNAVVGCVFFTLLMLTANTQMQSIRERIPEFAVLKTLGFTDNQVLSLVFAEAILLCGLAALVGLGLSLPLAETQFKENFGVVGLPWKIIIPTCIAYDLALALMTGVLPAWRVRRLKIVDALAGR